MEFVKFGDYLICDGGFVELLLSNVTFVVELINFLISIACEIADNYFSFFGFF